jgi:hypothetical protein
VEITNYFNIMNTIDIIHFKAISRLLTGDENKIRKTRIPKKHKPAIDELIFVIKYWQARHGINENNKVTGK